MQIWAIHRIKVHWHWTLNINRTRGVVQIHLYYLYVRMLTVVALAGAVRLCDKNRLTLACSFEPQHDKQTKWHVRSAKTQISLVIRPVWPESSLSAWRSIGSQATQKVHSEGSDQTGRMPSWSESSLGAHVILFVLTCWGSFLLLQQVSCSDKTDTVIKVYWGYLHLRAFRKVFIYIYIGKNV